MRLRLHNKARVKQLPYAATITRAPGSGDVTYLINLTGALTFNIVDSFCQNGDQLTLVLAAGAAERIVTTGGANGVAGTYTIPANSGASLHFVCFAGKYYPSISPDVA